MEPAQLDEDAVVAGPAIVVVVRVIVRAIPFGERVGSVDVEHVVAAQPVVSVEDVVVVDDFTVGVPNPWSVLDFIGLNRHGAFSLWLCRRVGAIAPRPLLRR